MTPRRPAAELHATAEARRVAEAVARPAAGEVDRHARFPHEAIGALREAGLLGALVPAELGGHGCSPSSVARMTAILGRACASTAMIFAMHQMQVLPLLRHAGDRASFREFLRAVAARGLLIASGTSETGTYGDLRSSIAAVESDGSRCRLRKACTAISYGAEADAILVTARREPNAHPGDQVFILLPREEYRLEQTAAWDTLGMRGTCSPPFTLEADFAPDRILPVPFKEIAARTLVPFGHLLWSAVWLGIAADAVSVCRRLVRSDARRAPGTTPPASAVLVDACAKLQDLRSLVAGYDLEEPPADADGPARGSAVSAAVRVNTLKIRASRLACEICLDCLAAAGLRAYTDAAPTGLGRHIRDVLSAPILISTSRLTAITGTLLLIDGGDEL
jgi:acyl-CoA dehydrogenase